MKALVASGAHDALAPAGAQAAHIAELWWILVPVCAVVFVLVMIALGWAVWRAPRAREDTPPDMAPEAGTQPARERKAARSVAFAVALSSILLIGLLAASIATDRALATLPVQDAVSVRITAHQWWWEVQYDDAQPTRVFATANELHVPVGRPIVATLQSDDVIHSFWVPSLHGKKDLIPGRTATIRFRADQPGRYSGICAEFCGYQHANMYFEVIAVSPAEFEAWAEAQRKSAAEPASDEARRGRELFMTGSCMMCHAIQGTNANGRKAPDLTHVASRSRLGAGAIANTPQELAAWIADPHKAKPGVDMPAHPLDAADLQALVAYLQELR
jgi:cytochrome c oxidase subunit II